MHASIEQRISCRALVMGSSRLISASSWAAKLFKGLSRELNPAFGGLVEDWEPPAMRDSIGTLPPFLDGFVAHAQLAR